MDNMKSRHAAYVETVEYKMVFILSGYRGILWVLGTDFLNNLRNYRYSQGKSSGMRDNLITLIDSGYDELNMDEVRLYSNYIAKILNYDENEFFECLKDKAYRLKYKESEYSQNARQLFRIMDHIDKNMM